jgi:mannose-1-phosphate guanylyltransferase
MAEFHTSHGAEGTMVVTQVSDPSKYGAVVHNPASGLMQKYVEKPHIFVSNRINAGFYIFQPSVLDRIENKPTSLERDIIPYLVREGQMYCYQLKGNALKISVFLFII